MSHPEVPGFDSAQAAHEDAHPDDGVCPCHAEHENNGCDGGYKLGASGSYTCDHEECHSEDDWWVATEYIESGYIENEIQLTFVSSLLGENDTLDEEQVAAALVGLDSALKKKEKTK